MRAVVEQIKKYYTKGIYSIVQINAMLDAGKFSKAEYIYIVGENQE